MSTSPIIYHLRPHDLRGAALVPLNTLRDAHPDLFDRHMAKYLGRAAIPSRPLPELGCHWGDCVQFSTVHPAAIRSAMLETGHSWPRDGLRFLAIPVEKAGLSASTTAIWLYTNAGPSADLGAAKTDVVAYSSERLATLGELPVGTTTYFHEMHALGRPPLLFVGIPHVLHRGPVALDEAIDIIV
ncbi:hypothetical protein V8J82_04595 [Gymnodinialimonas sp. 2305UL16-5]|uniref:hypothetical protein n=1 Tax=Gymnodinialimonas mytili TaxID=3126503 RepID=UPI003097E236